MRADIIFGYNIIEFGFEQCLAYLHSNTRKYGNDTLSVRLPTEIFEVVQSGRVYEGDTPHTYDTYFWFIGYLSHNLVEFVGYTEEVRSVYLVDSHTVGHLQLLFVQLEVALYIGIYLRTEYFDRCSLRGAFQE